MKIVLFIAGDNKRDSAISSFCRNKILTPAEILFKITRWLMTSSRRWLMRSQWYKMTWRRRLSRTQKTDSGHSNIRDHHKWWAGTKVRSSTHLRWLNLQRQTDTYTVLMALFLPCLDDAIDVTFRNVGIRYLYIFRFSGFVLRDKSH